MRFGDLKSTRAHARAQRASETEPRERYVACKPRELRLSALSTSPLSTSTPLTHFSTKPNAFKLRAF